MMKRLLPYLMLLALLLSSCFTDSNRAHSSFEKDENAEVDSAMLSFYDRHHYGEGYNFIVHKDSLPLLRQQPEEYLNGMLTDSFSVRKGSVVAVADIRIIGNDTDDSVWIQLATEEYTFGWTHESTMLRKVVPVDPISQFISTFSDTYLLIFLVIISSIAIGYLLRILLRRKARLVHINDIDTFFPSLLAMTVATAATFYSSIQLFAPDVWRHFYYHPTLNPIGLPHTLSLFLLSIWAILIIALAAVDDVLHRLPFGEAVLYLCGLAAVCAANYIIFSVLTLYYIGYPLLLIYIIFAIYQYSRVRKYRYVCGNCGTKMTEKGVCPNCGSLNK